jgi:serine/threonine protein kinase
MATVWEAEQEPLERHVAIKFIGSPDPALGSFGERFLEEARAAASVRHRNVVEILDFGQTEEGRLYMVMELLEGESLADRIEREAPMPVEEAVDLGLALLGALSAVHARGLVHRDLKPENVLFTRDEDGERPKLVDFGVSKDVVAEAEGRRRPKTAEGLLVGTPEYMSPEQARGVRRLDHRTDLFAVGVVLYEMLTGQRPFDSPGVGALLMKVMAGDYRPAEELRGDLPAGVAAVLRRALQVEPEDRYVDAHAMRAALAAGMNRPTSGAFAEVVERERPQRADPKAMTVPARRTDPSGEVDLEEGAQPLAAPASPRPSKPVEPPAPRTIPPRPSRERLGVALFLSLLAVAALPEIVAPGAYRALASVLRVGLGLESGAAVEDAGVAAEGETFTVRLENVPEDTRLFLDDAPLAPERVQRRGDDVAVTLPKRAGPYELRLERDGFRPFRVSRWGLEDVTRTVRWRDLEEER